MYTLQNPKSAVESIFETPRAPKAHLWDLCGDIANVLDRETGEYRANGATAQHPPVGIQ